MRSELLTIEAIDRIDPPDVDWDHLAIVNDNFMIEEVPFKVKSGREFKVIFVWGGCGIYKAKETHESFEVGFWDEDQRGDATGKGEITEVFQKTLVIIREYMKRNEFMPYITFSCLPEERGRLRLYRRMLRAFAPDGLYREESVVGPFDGEIKDRRFFTVLSPFVGLNDNGEPWDHPPGATNVGNLGILDGREETVAAGAVPS